MHKTCAVTLTGKCPPNRGPVRQRTELVQDTKALMVQDTKGGRVMLMDSGGGGGGAVNWGYIYAWLDLCGGWRIIWGWGVG